MSCPRRFGWTDRGWRLRACYGIRRYANRRLILLAGEDISEDSDTLPRKQQVRVLYLIAPYVLRIDDKQHTVRSGSQCASHTRVKQRRRAVQHSLCA